jgi:hypothetical protein
MTKYVVTIADKVQRFCQTCERVQYVYIEQEETADGSSLRTCCCICQRIIETEASGQGLTR